ncbi:hypothetical protein YC2023_006729 [Brassica napus]
MSAKLMYNLSDENPNLNKQFGCIDGIFQLFYRQHYPVRPVSVSDNVEKSSILATAAPFLVQWLHRFPKYNRREIYITGESYAGHYVPQLAREIMHYNKRSKNPINLKGIMVGNAVTDNHYDNLGTVPYWWSHAMISDRTYHQLVNTCEFSRQEESDECETVYSYAMEKEFSSIDQYNIYAPPCNKSSDGSCGFIGSAYIPGNDCRWDQVFLLWLSGDDVDSAVPVTATRVAEVFEGLTFVTVIGAGHEVPLSKPHAAFELFKYFLRGKPLPK